ncbi:hypothetical protein [uncultured Selenomonas sp.]|uniref:hypothetical protein n=1 Tax=uncultured Selenomonas sp. TaxID=159275 RepID=UPI0028D2769B|nr:hypothetical protein [uncultured Selenomonas sp.]
MLRELLDERIADAAAPISRSMPAASPRASSSRAAAVISVKCVRKARVVRVFSSICAAFCRVIAAIPASRATCSRSAR